MQLEWKRGSNILRIDDGTEILVTNDVRARDMNNPEEVVYTSPDDGSMKVPYMPTTFPVGVWQILEVRPKKGKYFADLCYIATDAWQMVPEWSLDADGSYNKMTVRLARDAAYGLHPSESSTTLGCIKIVSRQSATDLMNKLIAALDRKEKIPFIVKE